MDGVLDSHSHRSRSKGKGSDRTGIADDESNSNGSQRLFHRSAGKNHVCIKYNPALPSMQLGRAIIAKVTEGETKEANMIDEARINGKHDENEKEGRGADEENRAMVLEPLNAYSIYVTNNNL